MTTQTFGLLYSHYSKAFAVGLDFFDMLPRLGRNGAAADGAHNVTCDLIKQMQWR